MVEGKFQNSAADGQYLFTPISALNRKQTLQHQSLGGVAGAEQHSPPCAIKFPHLPDLSNEKFERQETEPQDDNVSAVSSPCKTYSSVTNLELVQEAEQDEAEEQESVP